MCTLPHTPRLHTHIPHTHTHVHAHTHTYKFTSHSFLIMYLSWAWINKFVHTDSILRMIILVITYTHASSGQCWHTWVKENTYGWKIYGWLNFFTEHSKHNWCYLMLLVISCQFLSACLYRNKIINKLLLNVCHLRKNSTIYFTTDLLSWGLLVTSFSRK